MAAPRVITLGCRLNTFESEVMRDGAINAGFDNDIIINTCAVTAEAERNARQTIRRTRRDNPGARIIVTGCAAQVNPEQYSAMPEVDRVVGNVEKMDPALLHGDDAPLAVSNIMDVSETAGHLVSGLDGRTRAFVQIQQGCDHRCTFCIIPFARGPNRSVPPARIIEQIRALCENGYSEVVLTGVDISSYGTDASGLPALGELVLQILHDVPQLPRLRLSSIDPAAVDAALFRALSEEDRLMPHLHLSLQAMDDMILKRMKRRHSREDAFDVCEQARAARPDTVFGADLIAGFPTETDAMFENTLSSIEALGLTFLHVFPYSERPGTPAANMPTVPGDIRKERAARLRSAGDIAKVAFYDSQQGTTAAVLVERDRLGHSQHFAPVELTFDAPAGAIVSALIDGNDGDRLIGQHAP